MNLRPLGGIRRYAVTRMIVDLLGFTRKGLAGLFGVYWTSGVLVGP